MYDLNRCIFQRPLSNIFSAKLSQEVLKYFPLTKRKQLLLGGYIACSVQYIV